MLNSAFQVSMMERDFYLGRILTGRIHSGIVRVGDKVHGLSNKDSGVVKVEDGKVCRFMILYYQILMDIYISYVSKRLMLLGGVSYIDCQWRGIYIFYSLPKSAESLLHIDCFNKHK